MKVIVSTTVNPSTEAIRKFAAMPGWKLVIVGDTRTPPPEVDCVYLDCAAQERIDKRLSDLIGWNCIQRRMMGIVWAWQAGAEVVASVDDDNIPLPGWGELLIGQETTATQYCCDLPMFDPVGAVSSQLWHRGFPLSLVNHRRYQARESVALDFGVQADFWNGDPDVDAVCREIHKPECNFEPSYFPLCGNKPSPFNSQNTFLLRRVLPDWFCFPDVGRMDDIWASLVAQAHGHRVVYGKPSVYQKRNQHDPMKDAQAELFGFKTLALTMALTVDSEAWREFVPVHAAQAFDRYRELLQ